MQQNSWVEKGTFLVQLCYQQCVIYFVSCLSGDDPAYVVRFKKAFTEDLQQHQKMVIYHG